MKKNSEKTILVTGGAGAIGSNLTKRLLKDGLKLVVLDDLSSGYLDNIPKDDALHFIKGDICDDRILTEAFSHKIDEVYHLAANFANQNSVDNPQKDLQTNGKGTLKLLEYALKNGVEKILFTSSSCLYKSSSKPFTEDMQIEMETPYSITKVLGEHYVNFFNKYHGLNTVILRYFNSYGPGEYPGKYRNVIPNFMWRAINGEPLPITGTGDETRSFTYVTDIVEGTVLAMGKCNSNCEVYNVGNEKRIAIKDLALKINRICGNKEGIKHFERRSWDKTLNRSCSTAKIMKEIGFKAEVDIDDGLLQTMEWFRSKAFNKKNTSF